VEQRHAQLALALGAVGYAVQAAAFFGSVERIDASLASLLLYTYPALVFGGAVALRREAATRRRAGALALTSGGALLVLAGAGTGALVVSAAAASVGAFTVATGGPELGGATPGGWAAVVGVALISTVLPVAAFLVLERVGPSTASIVSTAEPVVTVGLAMLVFGERLTPIQAAGGMLVVAAVVLLNARRARRRDPARALA
jgi:drug/metabolite transporter (DMT)-like permease